VFFYAHHDPKGTVMFTLNFWRQTGERAIKTAAQSVLTAWTVGDGIFNAFSLDYGLAAGFALGGAIFSVLTSIVSAPLSERESPSLVAIESQPPEPDLGQADLGLIVQILVVVLLVILIIRIA
jgi:hypothetical protein